MARKEGLALGTALLVVALLVIVPIKHYFLEHKYGIVFKLLLHYTTTNELAIATGSGSLS